MFKRLRRRLRAGLWTLVSDESGNATEYIVIAGIGVAILGTAIVGWNNGLATYLQGVLDGLTGL